MLYIVISTGAPVTPTAKLKADIIAERHAVKVTVSAVSPGHVTIAPKTDGDLDGLARTMATVACLSEAGWRPDIAPADPDAENAV